MFTLYYAPDNASLILRLALEELSLPYETILVDRKRNMQKSADYIALNPTGLIPTLITPQGPMAETAACLLWLADSYPNAQLAPGVHDPKRGAFLRWLFYLSNTVHADLIRLFYPDRYVPADTIPIHHAMLTGRLSGHLKILNAAVQADPALFAPPSALSLYLGPLLRWAALYPTAAARWLRLTDYPGLHALTLALETRACTRAAIRAEGLGETPFSAPRLATPPEGSAT